MIVVWCIVDYCLVVDSVGQYKIVVVIGMFVDQVDVVWCLNDIVGWVVEGVSEQGLGFFFQIYYYILDL